jgi:hypothetical protein
MLINFSKEVSEKEGLEKSRSRCVDNVQIDITGRVCYYVCVSTYLHL